MGIRDLVLSIKQMRELNKLGLDVVKTALCWKYNHIIKDYEVVPNRKFERSVKKLCKGRMGKKLIPIPTLTVQEMLEMLPTIIYINKNDYILGVSLIDNYYLQYENIERTGDYLCTFQGENIKEVLFKTLRFLLENKYLENGK